MCATIFHRSENQTTDDGDRAFSVTAPLLELAADQSVAPAFVFCLEIQINDRFLFPVLLPAKRWQLALTDNRMHPSDLIVGVHYYI